MATEDENLNSPNEETTVEAETAAESSPEELDATALKTKNDELAQANRQLFERAKKAEGFVKLDGKWVKAPKEPQETIAPRSKTGELDETSLLYLEVKGIKTDDPEEMKLVEDWRKDSGKDVKAIQSSKIFQAELKAIRDEKAVKDATPGATRRTGGQSNDFDYQLAKYEKDGVLPDDYTMRTRIVNAMADRSNPNKPAWHK